MGPGHLKVRVNDEFVLDAGTCEQVPGPRGLERVLHPPATTLFRQVLAYLKEKPDPVRRPPGSGAGREGVAAAALVLRWGSYLCVLLDGDKPLWAEAGVEGTSRISDAEMARINIEASAALAEWIDLSREDEDLYSRLVARALTYLPMPKKTSKMRVTPFASLCDVEIAGQLKAVVGADRLARVKADAERSPSRLFANAVVNVAWRNGPVENIHAGAFRGYPIDQRRVTPAEERELMRFAGEGLALGMTVCTRLALEQPGRPWSEQVLPYGLAEMLLITPSRWTLTESTREVRLPV